MNPTKTSQRYGSLSIAMHWLMLLLLIGVYACMELHEFYPKGSDLRSALKQWHFMLGLTVFFLVWVRLVLRLVEGRPPITPPPSPWQERVAGVLHVALYLFMICMPIGGWLILSGEGKPIPFYGLELPALIGKSREIAEQVEDIHKAVGTAGYALIGLHALAGLFHHYVQKDDTLRRMLPGSR